MVGSTTSGRHVAEAAHHRARLRRQPVGHAGTGVPGGGSRQGQASVQLAAPVLAADDTDPDQQEAGQYR
jgi:hypothetical protein